MSSIANLDRRFVLTVIASLAIIGACIYFTPDDTLTLLRNSAQLAACTGLLAVPASICLAYVMSRFEVSGRKFIDAGLLILLFIPLYVQLAAWEAGFGRGGWYSTLIAQRLSEPPLEGLRGAVWVHGMAAIPWLYWIFRLGFESMPQTYLEAASLDGSDWQVFRRITLPLCLPVFVGGALFVAIVTLTEITVTDRYQFRSYAEVIYNEFALNPRFEDLPLQLAPVTLNLAALVLLGLGVCQFAGARIVHATSYRPRTLARPRSLWPQFGVSSIVLLLLGLPLANLLYQAGIEVQQVGETRNRVWSVAKCVTLIATSPWKYREELAWSAILAQLSALSAVSIATLWAWWSYCRRGRQLLGMFVCVVCFATPGTLIALAIIRVLNQPNSSLCAWLYDDTLAAPWLAMTIKCLPFACLLLWQGTRTIPQSVIDAARVDGASTVRMLTHIALPLLRPSLLAAVVVCLAVSIGELSASLLVLPLDVTTVSARIFSLIHYGAEDQLAGLCLSCMALMVTLAWIAKAAFRRLN